MLLNDVGVEATHAEPAHWWEAARTQSVHLEMGCTPVQLVLVEVLAMVVPLRTEAVKGDQVEAELHTQTGSGECIQYWPVEVHCCRN